jgi:hypothetical protein
LIKDRDLDLYKVTGNIKQIREELRQYKRSVLDPMYEKLQTENAPFMVEALPIRYRRAPVTQQDGRLSVGKFLDLSPDEFRALQALNKANPA